MTLVYPPASAPNLSVPGSSYTGSYSASWSSVATATRYELQERLGSGSWSTIQNTSATSRAMSGKGNGTWGYRVRACNAGGCSSYSAIGSVVVTLPPATPSNLIASTPEFGLVSVVWSSVATATSYRLDHRPAGGSWSEIQNASATRRDMHLNQGNHEFRVRACNVAGCSAYSGILLVTVPPGCQFNCNEPLSAPQDVQDVEDEQ